MASGGRHLQIVAEPPVVAALASRDATQELIGLLTGNAQQLGDAWLMDLRQRTAMFIAEHYRDDGGLTGARARKGRRLMREVDRAIEAARQRMLLYMVASVEQAQKNLIDTHLAASTGRAAIALDDAAQAVDRHREQLAYDRDRRREQARYEDDRRREVDRQARTNYQTRWYHDEELRVRQGANSEELWVERRRNEETARHEGEWRPLAEEWEQARHQRSMERQDKQDDKEIKLKELDVEIERAKGEEERAKIRLERDHDLREAALEQLGELTKFQQVLYDQAQRNPGMRERLVNMGAGLLDIQREVQQIYADLGRTDLTPLEEEQSRERLEHLLTLAMQEFSQWQNDLRRSPAPGNQRNQHQGTGKNGRDS